MDELEKLVQAYYKQFGEWPGVDIMLPEKDAIEVIKKALKGNEPIEMEFEGVEF